MHPRTHACVQLQVQVVIASCVMGHPMDAHAQPYSQVTRCHWLAPRPEDTSSGSDLTPMLRCADFVPVQAPGRDVVDWWTLSTYRRAKVVFTRLRCAVWCCAQSDVHCL